VPHPSSNSGETRKWHWQELKSSTQFRTSRSWSCQRSSGTWKKFGVSAAAATVAVAAPAGGGAAAAVEEKTEFSVVLTAAGDNKVNVIKVVRAVTGLGLKEAKDLVDGAPKPVKEGIPKKDADDILKQIIDAGGKAEIK
jgi:large subunit ribosomal protein L7/L12